MRHRCAFLITLALAATAVGAPQGKAAKAAPPPIDLSTPEGAVAADRKMQCSLEDAKPVVMCLSQRPFTKE